MRLTLNSETLKGDVKDGKDYLIIVIRFLSLQPTLILEELSSDCLNELFASWVHSIYRMSIENGFSAAESVEKAINNRVMRELFTGIQIKAARKEADSRKIISKEIKNPNLAKAVS